jgi:chromosomal replication initiation ATPase DnaA
MNAAVDLFGQPAGQALNIQQLPLPLGWRERPARNTRFLVGPANREAFAALEGHATWPSPIAILFGPARSGKSLLAAHLQGLCPSAAVIDPARDVAEAELFHACNRAMENREPLLLVIDTRIGDWRPQLDDLATRTAAAQSLYLHEPDAALFAALLVDKIGRAGLILRPEVADYIAERAEHSYAEAEILAAELLTAAHGSGLRLGFTTARQILSMRGRLQGADTSSVAA